MSETEQLRTRVAELEASMRIQRAAAKEGVDGEAVAAILAREDVLAYVETDAEALTYVRNIAASKPQFRTGEKPAGVAGSSAQHFNTFGEPIISGEQLYALDKPQIDQLKKSNPALYRRSLEALGTGHDHGWRH